MDVSAYHAFCLKDRYFLLDVEACQVYSITYPAYCEITGSHRQPGNSASPPFWTRLGAMIEWRRFRRRFRRRFPEEVLHKQQELKAMDKTLKGLWLGVSHACNLACTYCFANEPAYLGKNKLMTTQTALKGVDYLVENSGSNDELSVIFFGGEPLLNLPVVSKTAAYCREMEHKIKK